MLVVIATLAIGGVSAIALIFLPELQAAMRKRRRRPRGNSNSAHDRAE